MARESHFASADTALGLVDVLLFPVRLIWGSIVFMVFAWTTSRSSRAFIFAIPAMLAVVVCVATVWAANLKGEPKAKALSSVLLIRSMAPGDALYDPPSAVLFGKKSVSLSPNEKFLKFTLAEAYALNEDTDKAFEIMNWLAPPVDIHSDQATSGYSDAHRWLASFYKSSDKVELEEAVRERLSRQHTELAYLADKKNVEAVLGLAVVHQKDAERLREKAKELRANGDTETADEQDRQADASLKTTVKHLNEAIDLRLKTPGQLYATVALMQILLDEGNEAEAMLTGKKFINKYENQATLNPDALPYWYSIVQACVLMKDFDRAEKYNERAFQLARNEQIREILRQMAAMIEVERSKSFEAMDDLAQFNARLYSLCKAMNSNLRYMEAYNEALYFVDGFEKGADQEIWLRDSILGTFGEADKNINPRIPGMIHVLIGLRDIIQAKAKEGRKHWEIAGQQNQAAPLAINFLIRVYDLERDLNKAKRIHLISTAIKQFPQSAFFYATRGWFLKEEGDFREAIEDYEFAVARIPGNISFLKELAECYRESGETEKLAQCEEQIRRVEEEQLRLENESLETFYSGPGEDAK